MKCSDVERLLPDIIDGAPQGANGETRLAASRSRCASESLPGVFRSASDLKLIASEARQLAATRRTAAEGVGANCR